MKLDPVLLSLLEQFTPLQRGVFTTNDLKHLFSATSTIALNQKLTPFLHAELLQRFCRGFYVAKLFDLEWLSQRLCPNSAISFGSVLAKEMIIGSIPQKTVYAVKIGKSRIYRSPLGQVVHLGFASSNAKTDLWFGYTTLKNGVRYADKEKAFLDTLYFYQSGHRFSFNVYSDSRIDRLDKKKMLSYLSRYKNPKFQSFVKGVIDGH